MLAFLPLLFSDDVPGNTSQHQANGYMATQNIYQQPILLARQKHKNLRFTPQKDLSFTKGMNSVPINGMEFSAAANELPILFGKDSNDNYFPLAILSFSNDGHLLLNEKGEWNSDVYLPIFLRRYPFVLSPQGAVLFDSKALHFADKESGKPLLTEEGEFTPVLKSAMSLLQRYEKQAERTREYARACKEAGLLKPCDLSVQQGKSNPLSLSNLYMLDAGKLNKLSDEQVVEWHRKGWLAWSYAHINSLPAMQRLLRRQRVHDRVDVGKR